MSPDGKLFFGFNKPIIKPPIKKLTRFLGAQRYYDINDVFDVYVKSDNNVEAEAPDNFFSITRYELIELTEYSLLIQLYFKMPDKISENIVDPDELVIKFKLGKIFIDEIDFQRLEESLEISIPLP